MGTICSPENEDTTHIKEGGVSDRLRPERKDKSRSPGTLEATPSASQLSVDESEGAQFRSDSTPITPSTNDDHQATISGFKDAVQSGQLDQVTRLVQDFLELDLFAVPFKNGDNALHVAVRNQHEDLVTYLLDNGITQNEQNAKGDTPLHIAVTCRNTNIVRLLADSMYDGDAEIENHNGDTAASLALEIGDLEIMELVQSETDQILKNIDDVHLETEDIDPSKSKATPVYSKSSAIKDTPTEIHLDDEAFDKMEMSQETLNERDDDYKSDEEEHDEEYEEIEDSALSPDSEDLKTALQSLYGETMEWKRTINAEQTLKVKCDAINQSSMTQLQELSTSTMELPEMKGWLQKKKNNYSWQRRWVMIKGSHILWSEKMLTQEALSSDSPPKIKNAINMLNISELSPIREGKTQRKFRFFVTLQGSKGKEYIWKATDEAERDQWVNGIQKHMSQMKGVVTYLKAH